MFANPRPLVANIYNPHNQSKAELVAGFVVRKKFFEKIFRDIRESKMQHPEQHYIIQGVRGMGKTTMLLRIAYEIENTPTLKKWLIPVVFNEEEYGISSLSDVWEKMAEYLEENSNEFAGLYENIVKHYQSDSYERLALDIIIKALQAKNKKIILLIDNIGDILEKFDEKEEQRLREVLLTTPEIRLIGATSIFLERFFDYKRPFFDFFKYLYLEGLTKDETLDLMLKLGEAFHAENIKQIVENEAYRIEVLRRLSGGVTRTMVLLFEIFVENNTGSAFKDLQFLIDRVTPLYKDRMDDLPKQQQKIVAALANFWEAATTKELAKAVRMESKVVSAQLSQLIKDKVVVKVETPTKNHLYRLEERFFNIWYLMRFGRKTDQRMLWLVRFMEDFIAGDEVLLQKRIEGHLLAIDNETIDPKAALYLTEAFSFLVKEKQQDYLVKTTRNYLEKKDKSLVKELSLSDLEKWEEIELSFKENNYKNAYQMLKMVKNETIDKFADIMLCIYQNNKIDKNDREYINKYLEKYMELETKDIESEKINETSFAVIILIVTFFLFIRKYQNEKEIFKSTEKHEILEMVTEYYFMYKKENRKLTLLSIFQKAIIENKNLNTNNFGINYIKILMWNNLINESIDLLEKFTVKQLEEENYSSVIKLFLAKRQYYYIFNYFQKNETYINKEYKPLYYATLNYLKDEYPTEYLRMPPELKETVEELIADIEQMAIDYA